MTSAESAQETVASGIPSVWRGVDPTVLDDLWRECEAKAWGLPRIEFDSILNRTGAAQNFGLEPEETATRARQAAWFRIIKLNDLLLAKACVAGNERAWEHFVAVYEKVLIRAAIAIAGNDTEGRDLASQLYAELYGLSTRDGQRRSPLDSYKGRGSLLGWLRTTLAQRHVDRFRQNRCEVPLKELDVAAPTAEFMTPPAELKMLSESVEEALRRQPSEERFLMASYYLDGRTLAEIARVIGVHEATVSRKLHRAIDGLRKQVIRNLESFGLSRRAAREALGTDPRELEIQLRNLLQNSPPETIQEKVAP
jgi:RNA polymerase sigma-70 factor (ECF subfamily)